MEVVDDEKMESDDGVVSMPLTIPKKMVGKIGDQEANTAFGQLETPVISSAVTSKHDRSIQCSCCPKNMISLFEMAEKRSKLKKRAET